MGSNTEQKIRLRPWLLEKLNKETVPGMMWITENGQKSKTIFKIPWKHSGQSGWSPELGLVFKQWAEHTGRYRENIDKEDYAKWKTNFRCAMNKSKDFEEIKVDDIDEQNPYKLYKVLPREDKNRAHPIHKEYKNKDLKKYEDARFNPLPSHVACYSGSTMSTNPGDQSSLKSSSLLNSNTSSGMRMDCTEGAAVDVQDLDQLPSGDLVHGSIGSIGKMLENLSSGDMDFLSNDNLQQEYTTGPLQTQPFQIPANQVNGNDDDISSRIENWRQTNAELNQGVPHCFGNTSSVPMSFSNQTSGVCLPQQHFSPAFASPQRNESPVPNAQSTVTTIDMTQFLNRGSVAQPVQYVFPPHTQPPPHMTTNVQPNMCTQFQGIPGTTTQLFVNNPGVAMQPGQPSIIGEQQIQCNNAHNAPGEERLKHLGNFIVQSSDDSNDTVVKSLASLDMNADEPQALEEASPILDALLRSPQQNNVDIGHTCPLHEENTAMLIQILFNGEVVQRHHVTSPEGCIISNGPIADPQTLGVEPQMANLLKTALYDKKDGQELIEFPSWPQSIDLEHNKRMDDLIANLSRGITVQCIAGSIYVKRLCKTSIYYGAGSVECEKIERYKEGTDSRCLLDFSNEFVPAVQQYDTQLRSKQDAIRPKPDVCLFVGQRGNANSLTTCYMAIKISGCKAAKQLRAVEKQLYRESDGVSVSNSLDKIEKQLQNFAQKPAPGGI